MPGEPKGLDGKLEVAWLDSMKTADAGPAAMRALVMEALERLSRLEDPAVLLASEDANLTRRWMKAVGKTLIGNLSFMLGLLKQGQPEWAVSLVPPPGRIWPGVETPFTRETEQMVASLAALGTTDAFRLRVPLSMKWDVTGAEAPAESLAARRVRLVKEFGERKKAMPLASPDAVALVRNLKEAGVTVRRPAIQPGAASPIEFEQATRRRIGLAKLRMSVLHSAATPEFVAAIGKPLEMYGMPGAGLSCWPRRISGPGCRRCAFSIGCGRCGR